MNNTIPTVLVPLTSTIPHISGKLGFKDVLGAIKVRWGIRRNSYTVDPGLYAIGKPGLFTLTIRQSHNPIPSIISGSENPASIAFLKYNFAFSFSPFFLK
jgi:hypothetical protein